MAVLRGADILFLPERFDETAKLLKMSISTKVSLFMFTGKPIVVYSDPQTGIAAYATDAGTGKDGPVQRGNHGLVRFTSQCSGSASDPGGKLFRPNFLADPAVDTFKPRPRPAEGQANSESKGPHTASNSFLMRMEHLLHTG